MTQTGNGPARGQQAADRYLVLLRPDMALDEGMKFLDEKAGLETVKTTDKKPLPPADSGNRGVFLHNLNVVVAPLTEKQLLALGQEVSGNPVQSVRPEGVMSLMANGGSFPPAPVLPVVGVPAFAVPGRSPDYLRGYRDGVVQLVGDFTGGGSFPVVAMAAPAQGAVPTANGGPPPAAFPFPDGTGIALPAAVLSPVDYLQGYRDGIAHLVDRLPFAGPLAVPFAAQGFPAPFRPGPEEPETIDETEATWGLQVTNVASSPFTGEGVRVAVLDTGLDPDHPDFKDGRVKESVSFVAGEDEKDKNGHGTACIGTACGPQKPHKGPRYGIAYKAEIYTGKVLDRTGKGSEGAVLAGINWALARGCRILALPFGMPPQGAMPHAFYEEVGRRALAKQALLIAASGGHSNRALKNVQPVAVPANGTTVLGVGAVKADLGVANFSNGGNPYGTGSVDLVGPGVNVRSAWAAPLGDRVISGTSMAAAHVAGIAALFAEMLGKTQPNCSGMDVINALIMSARPLPLPSTDVGRGLVQAPAPSYA